jgi:GcrA cell cycle regulator
MGTDWTEARVDLLVQLWRSGLSARQCGLELSCTRNAVIGKVHRLGLNRGECYPCCAWPRRQAKPQVVRIYQRTFKPDRPPSRAPINLVDLEFYHCRWPLVGEDGITRYCGAPRLETCTYCGWHARKAYVTPPRITPEERASRAAWMRQVRKRTARAA